MYLFHDKRMSFIADGIRRVTALAVFEWQFLAMSDNIYVEIYCPYIRDSNLRASIEKQPEQACVIVQVHPKRQNVFKKQR